MPLNSEIKTYPIQVMLGDIYKEINRLMKENIKDGAVPYVKETPLPQNMNIVSGYHLGDINKVLLELKASKIGAKSLKWIFGADAAFLGLELKAKENPVVAFANTIRNREETHGDAVENQLGAQTAYLLDQFTEKSIKRALSFASLDKNPDMSGNGKTEMQKKVMAQSMLRNICEYDTGFLEKDLRDSKRKNVASNWKDTDVIKDVNESFKNVTEKYSATEKSIFKVLSSYFLTQSTGLKITRPLSREEKKSFIKNLYDTSNVDSPRFAQIAAESSMFAERQTHLDFSYGYVYEKSEDKSKPKIVPPKAALFERDDKHINSRSDEKTMQNIHNREREREMNITHARGL